MRKSSNRKNRKYFSRLFNETRLCKTINNKIRTKNSNNRIKINNKIKIRKRDKLKNRKKGIKKL